MSDGLRHVGDDGHAHLMSDLDDPRHRLHCTRHRADVADVDEVGLLELQHVLQRVGVDVAVDVTVGKRPDGVAAALELDEVGSELVLGNPDRRRHGQTPRGQQRA
ncbi:Uncharacterised protein [Mycobacteroides abscessus subsp. abscessus]|nr:Uncharacterised protein [Mycobacteroides abscessus subsp. abscessus]